VTRFVDVLRDCGDGQQFVQVPCTQTVAAPRSAADVDGLPLTNLRHSLDFSSGGVMQ
jgi:hypothetical protein